MTVPFRATPGRRPPPSLHWAWLPALVAVAVAAPILRNLFALDDLPIITLDPRYASWRDLPKALLFPYWPPPFIPSLYRPLVTILLQAQRMLAGGGAWAVHAGSLVCYGLLTLALTRFLLPRVGLAAALVVGVLFAVHPLHTEAVAEGVNQADLLVSLFYVVSTSVYLRLRARGPLTAGGVSTLLGLHWLACFSKETGILLPAAWFLAEATLVDDARPWRERVTALRPFYLLAALSSVAFLGVRTLLLQEVRGTFAAAIFADSTVGSRALTMLGVVPELVRLMVWPAHLRTDYSVAEFSAPTAWGAEQTAGLCMLLGLVALLVVAWRRDKLAAFGLLLAAVGYGPVHNVLVPTGILIGERTLLLSTVGLAIALASLLARMDDATPRRRVLLGVPLALLAIAGTLRTLERWPHWHDQRSLWEQAWIDSPNSWQANMVLGAYAVEDKKLGTAERYFTRARLLYPKVIGPRQELAHLYRQYGRCDVATGLYLGILKTVPSEQASRVGLVTCGLWTGDYVVARWAAIQGAGWDNPTFRRLARVADSALKAKAPPHTVTVPDSTLVMNEAIGRREVLFGK